MPAGKLVFSGMELVKSSMCGSSVRISVWRGTSTGGSTAGEKGPDQITTAESDAGFHRAEGPRGSLPGVSTLW